jgi:hypothetical protein
MSRKVGRDSDRDRGAHGLAMSARREGLPQGCHARRAVSEPELIASLSSAG